MKDYHKVDQKDNMKVTKVEEAVETEKEASPVRAKQAKRVSKPVVKNKQGLLVRLYRGLVGPDGAKGIFEQVKTDIIMPALKNILVDSVKTGIDIAVFKESRPVRSNRVTSGSVYTQPKTNYNRQYSSHVEEVPPRSSRMNRFAEEYLIADRNEAMEILVDLKEAADAYGAVPVADYYDKIGIKTTRSDYDYGWTYESICRAVVAPMRGCYIIKFPQLEVL